VSLVSVVRRANPERAEEKAGGDLITPDRLKRFDVVILGDMEANYLGDPEYRALLGWLDETGHALLVLGGYHSFGPDGFRASPLAEALPVVFAEPGQPAQSEEPFVLHLTDEGRRHPAFELTGDRVKDAATWSTAPPLTGTSLVRRAKPGADVLAVHPGVAVEGRPAVVAAVQRFGAGHTMVLAADTTWRWSRLTRVIGRSDTLYARFWSQTVRWLAGRQADDERPPAGRQHRPAVLRRRQAGHGPRRAAAAPRRGPVLGRRRRRGRRPEGRSVPVPVRAGSAEPDVFTGTFFPTVAGRYEVAASCRRGPARSPTRRPSSSSTARTWRRPTRGPTGRSSRAWPPPPAASTSTSTTRRSWPSRSPARSAGSRGSSGRNTGTRRRCSWASSGPSRPNGSSAGKTTWCDAISGRRGSTHPTHEAFDTGTTMSDTPGYPKIIDALNELRRRWRLRKCSKGPCWPSPPRRPCSSGSSPPTACSSPRRPAARCWPRRCGGR
jgi:uncharacterized membrane protein